MDPTKDIALVNKWKRTGLLENLKEPFSDIQMAHLLEKEARYVLTALDAEVGDKGARLKMLLFPILRRIYGDASFPIDYRVSQRLCASVKLYSVGVDALDALKENTLYGIDAEVEFCACIADGARSVLMEMGPIMVGSVPLGVRELGGQLHFYAWVEKR